MKEVLKISLKRDSGIQFLQRFLFKLFLVIVTMGIVTIHSTLTAQGTQRITVTGTVSDGVTGQPMPGVNVVVQGSTVGVITDIAGKFSINVPNEQSVLVISFIGYAQQNIPVGRQRQINVALSIESLALEEVVVVGYGVQKKESVVGAVTQASGELVKSSVQGSDLGNALTGALPGLVTISTTGLPGGQGEDDDYALMFIRGQKTWNNAAPLVLVDGVERPLQNINPYEIEKISILKDASATAVFGVKGANGVILITSLRGKEGKPVFSIDATTTAKTVSRIPHREGSYLANLAKNYAILNEVATSETSWGSIVPYHYLELYQSQKYPYYLPDVDWTDEFVNDVSWDRNANMTVSGGTKFVKYFGAIGYTHEGDILKAIDFGQGYSPNFSFSRVNYRSNLDFDITPTTRFSANFSGYFSEATRPGGDKYAIWPYVYSAPPDLWPNQYQDGVWGDYNGFDRYTNGILAFNMFGQDVAKTTNINTDFFIDQKLDFLTKGLSFNAKLSYDNTTYSTGPNIEGYGALAKWISPTIIDDPAFSDNLTPEQLVTLENKYTTWKFPDVSAIVNGYNWVQLPNNYVTESGVNDNTFRNLYYQLSLNYTRDFGKHSVSALGLMSRQVKATGSNFASYREDWVGRVTYGYNRRYLFELNAAYNGSEKFAPEYRFGFFPSLAVGWVISNEHFFDPVKKIVSTLKIRYSDGMVGSDEGIERWLYVGDWITKSNTTSSSNQDVSRFGAPFLVNAFPLRYEGVIPNPDIQWETAHKRDLGIETAFFKDQLKINFDYFNEFRSNIFMVGTDIKVPAYFGAMPVSANRGKVKMHGWEFEANFSRTTSTGLTYWFNHSWTFAIDEILERGDPELKPFYLKQAGYQIDQPRHVINQSSQAMGTWNDVYGAALETDNTYLLPGDFAQVDYNGDGFIDSNDEIPYGYPPRPQFSYAPSAGLSFKNISANVRFYGVYNVEGEAGTYRGSFANQYSILNSWDYERSWSPEFNLTTNAIEPALRYLTSSTSGFIPTSRSYTKLQHAEIGYEFSRYQLFRKMGVTRLRILLSGDNLILWSKMTEDLDADRPTAQTNTRRTYPKMKRFNLGISLRF